MKIKQIVVGDLEENCYVIQKNGYAIIIDPGEEAEKIEKEIEGCSLVGILLTHHHFDHVGALCYFEQKYHLKHNTKIEEFFYEVILTPGHSKDSVTFYFPQDKVMFTGDFLFQKTIGRMDFEGGSPEDMFHSLQKIKKYPDEITIYPGHGPKSNLGQEKKYFPFYFPNL